MPVNQKSIEALRNPDTIAKSLATRKRNRENRELLKQKLAYDKLDNETSKLVNNIKTQVVEENNAAIKLSNLEYANKALESVIDNLKEQLRVNTQSITTLSNKINIVNPTATIDSEARERIKKTIKSFNEAIEAIDDKLEQNTAELTDIYSKINASKLESKIDNLFKIFYSTQPKTDHINQYCEYYNTQVQQPVTQRLNNNNLLRPSTLSY
jgi:chromosome segregation ATPase